MISMDLDGQRFERLEEFQAWIKDLSKAYHELSN